MYYVIYSYYYLINTTVKVDINTTATDKIVKVNKM
jgi:hypothetical protein